MKQPSNASSNSPQSAPYFVTTGEFSHYARLSISTVKRMCDKGELAHVVISERGDRRIPRQELDRLLGRAEGNRAMGSDRAHGLCSVSYPLLTMGAEQAAMAEDVA
jgi:excisionase family DNA binding protein